MTDPTDKAPPPRLTPANQNPWYVLATLYGEQEAEEIDRELHGKNRAVWNAWSFQDLTVQEIAAQAPAGLSPDELAAWHSMEQKVTALHEKEWRRRNGADVPYPGMPEVAQAVDLEWIAFSKSLTMEGFIFRSAVLFDEAVFRGNVSFDHANFIKSVWFNNVVFGKSTGFGSTLFGGESAFAGTAFFGNAWFAGATFTGDAWFLDSKFLADAVFQFVAFNRQATFMDATFGAKQGDQVVSFANCQFDKSLNLRGAIFLARYPVFSGAITADRNVFTAKSDHWPKTTTQNPEQARESCAAIRHMLDKQGLPEEAHFFFRREMEFAGQIGSIWQRLPYLLYGKLSDYGQSIARPAIGLAGVFVLGWAVIRSWLGRPDRPAGDVQWFDPIPEALVLSIANTLPFLGLARTKLTEFHALAPPGLVVFSAVQSLAGIVLLFLLGLGLRTRFRMR
jgi:hypothetical protein